MEINKVQWRMIAKGAKLPCDSFLMKKDGTMTSMVTGAGVTVGQDAYYLPVEELRSFPKEESEDERIRKGLIDTFSIYYKDEPDAEWDGKPVKDILAWLEKQQKPAEDRYMEGYLNGINDTLKSVEWSEEDEKMRAAIIFTLAGFMGNEDKIDWLKSLRPQSQWKPSKEQLGALWDSIKHNLRLHPVLESLYQDLKKLREE